MRAKSFRQFVIESVNPDWRELLQLGIIGPQEIADNIIDEAAAELESRGIQVARSEDMTFFTYDPADESAIGVKAQITDNEVTFVIADFSASGWLLVDTLQPYLDVMLNEPDRVIRDLVEAIDIEMTRAVKRSA